MVQANKAVRISGKPNFSGCRIPVPSSLNLEYLEKKLADYKDRTVIQLLRYGCPINYEGRGNLSRACHNHRGATNFPEYIERLLKREVEAASVMGPFKSSSFDIPTTVSPLNIVPMRDSADRRVIVDLSFPKCKQLESVNGGISRDWYLGDPIQLRYPSVDNWSGARGLGVACSSVTLVGLTGSSQWIQGIYITWGTNGTGSSTLTQH